MRRTWLVIAWLAATTAGVALWPMGDESAAGARTSALILPVEAVLRDYGISPVSQTLVFSKTSLQRLRIDAEHPRAIYYNDHAAIGWVPGSPLLEIAVFDGLASGVRFMTLDLDDDARRPRVADRCIQCHALPGAGGLPGLIMRSSDVQADETTRCLGDVDDTTPFYRRWGGWYVTGPLVPPGHAGRTPQQRLAASYPSTGSDAVALLVLGHQVSAVNLIARLARETQLVAGDPERVWATDHGWQARVDAVADYLLFLDETPLPAAVRGDPAFQRDFESAGVRDGHGHSLRRLDLDKWLFRVPCSYMIQSAAFQGLPAIARRAVYDRISQRLGDRADARVRTRVSERDRETIAHILRATIADLPSDFLPARPTL